MRPNRNNTLCRLRVLSVVKTEFLFVLCLFDPSVPDVHDCMQAGGTWAGNTSGYMLAPDWCWGEVLKQEEGQDICLPLIGLDGK